MWKSCGISEGEQPYQSKFFQSSSSTSWAPKEVGTFPLLSICHLFRCLLGNWVLRKICLQWWVRSTRQSGLFIFSVCGSSVLRNKSFWKWEKKKGRKKCWIQKSMQAALWANDQERQNKQKFHKPNEVKCPINTAVVQERWWTWLKHWVGVRRYELAELLHLPAQNIHIWPKKK